MQDTETAGRPTGAPRLPRGGTPTIPKGGTIPGAPEPLPDALGAPSPQALFAGARKGRSVPADEACRMRLAAADPWWSKREVAAYRNISTSTLDRQIKEGLFPRGEPISARRRGWRMSVVKAAPPVA